MLQKTAIATIERVITPTEPTSGVKIARQIRAGGEPNPTIPPDLIFDPSNVYTLVRGISARVNNNYDGWPRHELLGEIHDREGNKLSAHNDKFGYRTFVGKYNHLDHNNTPSLGPTNPLHYPRGVILAARYIEDETDEIPSMHGVEDPIFREAGCDAWVELLVANNRNTWPKLCEGIENGTVTKVSMGCFIPGTPITLADGSRKPIESIVEGDEVLTHTGKIEPVQWTMERPYKGLVYDVRSYAHSEPMVLTPEHPVWINRDEPSARDTKVGARRATACVCGRSFKSRQSLSAHLREAKRREWPDEHAVNEEVYTGWTNAEDLKPGDWVLTPMPDGVGHPGSYPFARLLGYYLAEGNLGWDRARYEDKPVTVEWSFCASEDKDEIEYVEEIVTLLEAMGYKAAGPYTKNNAYSIRCNSPELAAKFLEYGGKYSFAKRVHPEVMGWEPINQRALVEAYLNGDARITGDYDHFLVGAASKVLAEQIHLLCIRSGISVSGPREFHSPSTVAAGRRSRHMMQGTLNPPKTKTDNTLYSQKARLNENGLWRRITDITIKQYEGNVYNFDVDGDDSYVASNVAVHNCEIVGSTCSACGNYARHQAEFCSHIVMGRGQRMRAEAGSPYVDLGLIRKGDDVIAHERTHGVEFFEISWISDEQADPTAVLTERIQNEEPQGISEPHGDVKQIVAASRYPALRTDFAYVDGASRTADREERDQRRDERRDNPVTDDDSLDKAKDEPAKELAGGEMDLRKPPNEQDGVFYPSYPFPCSALVAASEANPDDPVDTTINVGKCQGCMYNRSDLVASVDCSHPEVVRSDGADPLPVGYEPTPESERESSGFYTSDGTPIRMLPSLRSGSMERRARRRRRLARREER